MPVMNYIAPSYISWDAYEIRYKKLNYNTVSTTTRTAHIEARIVRGTAYNDNTVAR